MIVKKTIVKTNNNYRLIWIYYYINKTEIAMIRKMV